MRPVPIGSSVLEFDSPLLGRLRDSDASLGAAELRSRLAEDGYLLLRGLIPRQAVLAARARVQAFLQAGNKRLMGVPEITHSPELLRVLEAPELRQCLSEILGDALVTTNYKWLRAVPQRGFTGAHFDWVYMGRGSQRMLTSWLPIGDVSIEHGSLAILEHSHRSAAFARVRETYGQMDVDRDQTEGWFSNDAAALASQAQSRWLTTDYQAGDVAVFGLHCMHMSCQQQLPEARISCDVRWQPASDPCDPRWFGEQPQGHDKRAPEQKPRSMQEARAAWGV